MQIEVVEGRSDAAQAQAEYDFFVLAKMFSRHYHEPKEPVEIKLSCLVCAALKEIDFGQRAVSEMLDGRNKRGRYEEGYDPAKPF